MQRSYASAGVDIDAQDRAIDLIRAACRGTYGPQVVTDVGSFGGMWALDLAGCLEPVLVSSIDGVGTKLRVASLVGRHRGIGLDLVHHCINDIAVMGARPLFFLDYFGTGKLEPAVAAEVVEGLAAACREVGCALIGGELAEMPGLYQPGDYDLVGCIVGLVDRAKVIDGSLVRAGDVVLGLASSGLHTNGYSLARQVLLEDAGLALEAVVPELGRTLADALLEPHRLYLAELQALAGAGLLKAAAHVTGGGLLDNLPRVLPAGLGAELERGRWPEPAVFDLIRRLGHVPDAEMYRTFNLGLGLLVVVAEEASDRALGLVTEAGGSARPVGRIVTGSGVRVRHGGER